MMTLSELQNETDTHLQSLKLENVRNKVRMRKEVVVFSSDTEPTVMLFKISSVLIWQIV
jgi:hypothetical protein